MSPTPMLFLLFAVCLLIHIPIGYSLAISSLVVVLVHDIFPPSFIIQTFFPPATRFPCSPSPFSSLPATLCCKEASRAGWWNWDGRSLDT